MNPLDAFPEKQQLLQESIARHQADNTTSFNKYFIERRIAWGKEVSAKQRVYLDTNYWVALCEFSLGRSTDNDDRKLSRLLGELVTGGRIICPITYHHFQELMRQSDPITRMETARVMDRLSGQAVLQPFPVILSFELDSAVALIMQNSPHVFPAQFRIWTHPAYILGDHSPKSQELPEQFMLLMKKSMDDVMWSLSLSQLLQSLPTLKTDFQQEEQALIDRINTGKDSNPISNASFTDYFKAEVIGVFSLLGDELIRSVKVVEALNDIKPEYLVDEKAKLKLLMSKLIQCTVERKMDAVLPFIVVQSLIHASTRYETKRRFKAGDLEDIGHAAAALPYYNYFFTESSLGHRVTTNPTDISSIYGTTVARSKKEAISILESLK